MGENKLNQKITSGFLWKFLERIFAQGVSFAVSVVLARLLIPDDYGVVTLVLVFINIANVFTSSGFGEALIQKKNSDDTDFSTLFYCAVAVSLFIYIIIFLISKPIALFYGKPIICSVVRVMGLKIPISAVSTIQHAYVSKNMQFKKFFFSTLGGTIVSGIVGVILAYKGFGVWALVTQYLLNTIIDTIVLFITIEWRPKLVFSTLAAKRLLGDAWKLTGSSFINTTYSQLYNIVIGKLFSTSQLAYYNKGNQFPSLIVTNVDVSIASVMFPTLSNVSDSNENLKHYWRKSLIVSCYCMFPLLVGLGVVSRDLIKVLLTEKWIDSTYFLIIGCICSMFQPIQTNDWQVIKAAGKSAWCLKLEIVKKCVGLAILIFSLQYGIKIIAALSIINTIFSTLVNMYFCGKIIECNIFAQLRSILPNLILSLIMGLTVFFIGIVIKKVIIRLLIQVIAGAGIYFALSHITKNESYIYIITYLKQIMRRKL